MAGKKKQVNENYYDMPETLDNHQFYGLKLDDEQKIFRDAIWSDKTPVVFCNAKAGTGKTLIAAATANLLVQYHKYNGIVYIAAPVMESKQGFLKGSLEEKSIPYFEPFYEALTSIGVNINTAICDDYENDKFGTSYIKCLTNTFLRGCNFENKVIIVDESQNNYFDELKKILTRVHDNCKLIVIGHSKQCDILHNPERSGFEKYLNHFSKDERCAVCQLTQNHRGWISSYADELE